MEIKDYRIDLYYLNIEEISNIDIEGNDKCSIILLNSSMDKNDLSKIFDLTEKYEINTFYRDMLTVAEE